MSRRLTLDAEIVRRGHDAGAEMMLPEPVDNDAGGQRMVRARQPTGQSRSSPGSGQPGRDPLIRELISENYRETWLKFRARLSPIAVGQQKRGRRLRTY